MLIGKALEKGIVVLNEGVKFDDQINIVEFEDDGTSSGPIVVGKNTILRCGTVICSGVHIGESSIIGHNCVLRVRAKIGDNTVISHLVNIERDVRIGSRVRISAQTHLTGGCLIEDDCHIGANVATINDRNLERKADLRAPIFRKGSRIGSGVTVMANVEIGEHALVGASSLVLKDVPNNHRVYGSPARGRE